jgi:hypothetical protein
MDQEQWNSQGTDYQQQANGTGDDMPTGLRPCPFCHAVIPWASETCPSCGRVLIERVETGRQPTPPPTRGTSWSIFQPARRPSRSWWPRSIPAPTELERRVFIVSALFMAFVFVLALLLR